MCPGRPGARLILVTMNWGDNDMRYGLAIIGALIGAALAGAVIGAPLASWVVEQMTFNSPVGADDMHGWIYLASIVIGLLVGWAAGWSLGGRLREEELDI